MLIKPQIIKPNVFSNEKEAAGNYKIIDNIPPLDISTGSE